MQGILRGLPSQSISALVKNNTSTVRKSLSEFLTFKEKDRMKMPVVMVMWSPFYDIQVFQGEDAYPFLFNHLFKSIRLKPPSDMVRLKIVMRNLIDSISGIPPELTKPTREGLWQGNSITEKYKNLLKLEASEIKPIF